MSRTPGTLATGGLVGNSGAQAINLAYLLGARRLVLVGFDMRVGGDRRHHFFGDHPKPLTNGTNYALFVRGMGGLAADLAAEGVNVLNASTNSALPFWPRCSIPQAIDRITS